MIYSNKFYSIEDIAKKLKINEKDIWSLINFGIIPVSNLYGAKSLRGNVALNIVQEIKKFNQTLEQGKFPERKFDKNVIKIKKEDMIN